MPLRYLRLCSLSVIVLLAVYSFANECEQGRQSHPQWLWCDDFESSDTNINARYQDVSTSGLSVVRDHAFEGSNCLRQHYTQGQIDAGWICRVQDQGFPDHIFMRWYHAFDSDFEGFPEKLQRSLQRMYGAKENGAKGMRVLEIALNEKYLRRSFIVY